MLKSNKEIELPIQFSAEASDSIKIQFNENCNGIVVIGANGSGKSRLGAWIEKHHPELAHRISAQKSLVIPESVSPISVEAAHAQLLNGHPTVSAPQKLANRWGGHPEITPLNDFNKLLIYLFSEDAKLNANFINEHREGNKIAPPPSRLTKIKEIWEKILPHRLLKIEEDRIEVSPKSTELSGYHSAQMSDGEKVIFYLIGQSISAPQNGIIIIDEPEIHLHKSILDTLWTEIESSRKDCAFIYLTHDMEFAVSRVNFKKIWLNEYQKNVKDEGVWIGRLLDVQEGIPENIFLELLGNRKKILFIEGTKNSKDIVFYKNIFHEFFIIPSGSCENVIDYTKSLKNNKLLHKKEVYGLIDRDRRTDEEIASLEEHNIFTLSLAEIENIFCTPEMVKVIAEHQRIDDINSKVEEVKNFIFNKFKGESENQIKIHEIDQIKFRLSRLDLKEMEATTLGEFIESKIDMSAIETDLKNEFKRIVEVNDYEGLLKLYNRKSLALQMEGCFKFNNGGFVELIIGLSKENPKKFRKVILSYLPEKFKNLLGELTGTSQVGIASGDVLPQNLQTAVTIKKLEAELVTDLSISEKEG